MEPFDMPAIIPTVNKLNRKDAESIWVRLHETMLDGGDMRSQMIALANVYDIELVRNVSIVFKRKLWL